MIELNFNFTYRVQRLKTMYIIKLPRIFEHVKDKICVILPHFPVLHIYKIIVLRDKYVRLKKLKLSLW
jgi:hypothetical protein